jgi:putative DNA methylase
MALSNHERIGKALEILRNGLPLLLKRNQRDNLLTVSEATHHLIHTLDRGKQPAAGLLNKLGAVAAVGRDLSHRLHTVCERRKWAQDASGYSALVLSWPDLKRLADEQKASGSSQVELI